MGTLHQRLSRTGEEEPDSMKGQGICQVDFGAGEKPKGRAYPGRSKDSTPRRGGTQLEERLPRRGAELGGGEKGLTWGNRAIERRDGGPDSG